jgi:acetyl esterase/lipase
MMAMKRLLLCCAMALSVPARASSQAVIPLYAGPVPDSRPSAIREDTTIVDGDLRVANVVTPTLTVFLPPRGTATGTSVVICPGGAYAFLAIRREGWEVAKRLNAMGIAAFVLKSRLPDARSQVDPTVAPLLDARQALRLVRRLAPSYHLDTARIGIMGFSAGGHLAAAAASRFAQAVGGDSGSAAARPSFAVLVYPVIGASDTLSGSVTTRVNLLGGSPTAEQLRSASNERQVTSLAPPVFLVHAGDDPIVSPLESVRFYEAAVRHGVPAEMHLYQKGGHGFGVHIGGTRDDWTQRLGNWLDANGWGARR